MARGDRSVDVNVTRLRAKLADVAERRLEITTQTGVGYRLELTDAAEVAVPRAAAVTTL
jgi:DNA-binding response OmpR family regulator